MTPEQIELLAHTYDKCINHFIQEAVVNKTNLMRSAIAVSNQFQGIDTGVDYEELARDAFLRNCKEFFDFHSYMESGVKQYEELYNFKFSRHDY